VHSVDAIRFAQASTECTECAVAMCASVDDAARLRTHYAVIGLMHAAVVLSSQGSDQNGDRKSYSSVLQQFS
jgi:hypothetical protein